MEQEADVQEERNALDPSTGAHSGHQNWASAHHYPDGPHGMGNVVQIIVPELSCLGQADSGNALTNSLHHATTTVELTGGTVNGTVVTEGTLRNATLSGVKDSLSALAAAAELDQVRTDVLHHVDNIIDESKYIEITTADSKSSEVIAHVVDKPSGTILHTYNFEPKSHNSARPLPMAPFLYPLDPDAIFYNEIFHYLCSTTFPEGVSEVYKKVIKKRATNYMINEQGTLSYGHKVPKQVLTSKQEQTQILETTHVDKETRVHYGVRKMYNLIFSKYYWRSLYVDIGYLVRSCEACSETSFNNADGEMETRSDVTLDQVSETLQTDRVMRVWKRVKVNVHGPYRKTMYGNVFLISIVDPFSKWILARPTPRENLENNCASFIFESFCTYGFAQCQVVGMSSESFETMQTRYREKFDNAQDILRNLVPFDSEDAQHSFMFTLQEKTTECLWAGEMFDELSANNPDTWDDEVSRLLFHCVTARSVNGATSPFAIMFARGPTGYVSAEEKENVNILHEQQAMEVPANRRRLRSSTLQCRHCYETFTSKISFRIHQRKHTEEAQRRGTMEGEKRLSTILLEKKYIARNKKKRRIFGRGTDRIFTVTNVDWSEQNSVTYPCSIRHQFTQCTVEAVKNLLLATKEERSKRGKYFKYTPELRDEIAQYALDHSIPAATAYWSARLGNTVSESSIRNFIKTYRSFSIESKEEIGKYAFNHGIERAVLHYTEKLGFEVRKGIVLKFKKYFMKKFYDGTQGSEPLCEKGNTKRNTISTRQKRSFSFQMKEEIGRYASIHGITPAINHFSDKLQFPVKESTVRKFKRQYLERNATLSNQGRSEASNEAIVQESSIMGDQQNTQQGNMDGLHPLSVLSGPTISGAAGINVSAPNNFIYQHPYPLNMAPGNGPGNTTVIPMNHNSITFHQGGVINQGVASLSYQQTPPTVIMNQPFTQMAPSTFQQGYIGSFAQPGPPGNAQGTPLSISHATVSPSPMSHNNTPLQLTMGSPHLGQINPVSLAQPLHLGPHNSQIAHCSPHHSHQLNISSYHQHVPGSLSFESPIGHQVTVSLNNEPLSLMKETPQVVATMQQQQQQQHQPSDDVPEGSSLHEAPSNVAASGIETSIVHIPNSNVLESTIHVVPQSQHHQPLASTQDHPTSAQHHTQPPQHEAMSKSCTQTTLDTDEEECIDPPLPRKKKKTKRSLYLRNSYTCGKRGNYVSYSPELRAEIGKYAVEHGNLAAITYFKDKLCIDIPESTVRGLKDKYSIKCMRGEKDVKCLGFAQRGRPMRLGKYDSIVQECIKELIKGGEKVSSFLVIATAKQVLMQYEPSLLEENGGPVKLNPTWAKSFLKRIGVSQLS